jgi:hypothetical protein
MNQTITLRRSLVVLLALAALALLGALLTIKMATGSAEATHGGTGNGAPNGAHYTVNIIGVKDKTAEMKDTSGHTIFVPLWGKANIWLCEAGVDADCDADEGVGVDDFVVLDRNGTDGDGALFALPNPDPDGDGTTVYSVFARPLGTPGGKSFTTTCAAGPDGVFGDDPSTALIDEGADDTCSVITLVLERDAGRSRFDNVSKYLLYIYADLDGDGDLERLALFDDRLENYLWYYDNQGLRIVQLRFYQCSTTVPDPDDLSLDLDGDGVVEAWEIEAASSDDSACFSGAH